MSRLNPEKLFVEFRGGVTTTEPIVPRRYTLTHSDLSAELFLTIGSSYAYDKITSMRDEVFGEWVEKGKGYNYYVYVYLDNELVQGSVQTRNYVFRRELPLALEAIRYGDRQFFEAHSILDISPIIVFFLSCDPMFNKIEYWGTFKEF